MGVEVKSLGDGKMTQSARWRFPSKNSERAKWSGLGGSLPLSTITRELGKVTGTQMKRDLMKGTHQSTGTRALEVEQGSPASTTPTITCKATNCRSEVKSGTAPTTVTSSSGVPQRLQRPPLQKSSGIWNSQGIMQVSRPSGKLRKLVRREPGRKDSGCSWSNSENTFGMRRFATQDRWKMGSRLKEVHQKFPTLATTSASYQMEYSPTRCYVTPVDAHILGV